MAIKSHTFPSAEILSPLLPVDLDPLRCGYRAPYIISAAQAVNRGEIDLENLKTLGHSEALKELVKLSGVGAKVANCVILFGLHNMSGFPIDVWIRRALDANFPPGFDPATLGEFSGLAQQYMFYYERENAKASKTS